MQRKEEEGKAYPITTAWSALSIFYDETLCVRVRVRVVTHDMTKVRCSAHHSVELTKTRV